jgi:hypothetical protein
MERVSDKYGKLKRGTHPFGVNFLKWQDSSLGKYVEFEVSVNYLEGS